MTSMIVFGEDWGAHPSSTQHLMPYVAEDFDIIWINSIGLRRPALTLRDMKRVWQKLWAKLAKPKPHSDSASVEAPFTVVNPLVIPLSSSLVGRWLNRKLLARQVRPLLKSDADVWVWSSLPSAIDFKGVFGESRWLYYCGDDFSALAGVDHDRIQSRETQLAQQAQRIWVASEALKHRLADVNGKVTVVEHGVDIDKFSAPYPRPLDVSAETPTLGFYGAIADWIDQDLLVEIAKKRPDWQLVLIGPQLVDVSRLQAMPNILLLPAKPHHELPAYLQHWRAAILPFKDCPQIQACNPLKLREYLASGTPLLSVDFPALEPYRGLVNVITDADSADAALALLAQTETVDQRQQRQRRVASESWAARAGVIRRQLQDCRDAVL